MDLPCEDTTCEFRVALPIIPNDVMNKRLNGQLPRGKPSLTGSSTFPCNPPFLCKMNYSVEGSSGNTNETYVVWSIDSKHVDVNASIDENGVITVDRNSKPGYLNVRATLQGTNSKLIACVLKCLSSQYPTFP